MIAKEKGDQGLGGGGQKGWGSDFAWVMSTMQCADDVDRVAHLKPVWPCEPMSPQ